MNVTSATCYKYNLNIYFNKSGHVSLYEIHTNVNLYIPKNTLKIGQLVGTIDL